MNLVVDVAAAERFHRAKMQNGQFGGGQVSFLLQKPQYGVFHQMIGVRARFAGKLRKLRFLLGSELQFHNIRLRENRPRLKF